MSGEGAFYRYTVKCDRAFNAAIEKAARKAGVSATTFVQTHFDGILEAVPPPPLPGRHPDHEPSAPPPRAHRVPHVPDGVNLTRTERALLDALAARADGDGHVSAGMELLARDIGTTPGSVRVAMTRLREKHVVRMIRRGTWKQTAVSAVRFVPLRPFDGLRAQDEGRP
ncbi:hypothetical protein [Aquibium oceanicum]|uniref:Uncharacterized protein n=1 Tax=Aquibium oceanicum TaxID=1670800 RepID=A0A1L3SQ20_9HYPH|nr:hypothetical protein [Aquibium oceanicum]APH71425.1 hypothetical protein BSQ44_08635 [Aquibium oceanicum]